MGKRWRQRGVIIPPLAELPLITVTTALETMSWAAVQWKVDSGRWQRFHQGVYITHSGPVDWPTRAVAGWLSVTRPSTAEIHRLSKEPGYLLEQRLAGLGGWSAAYVEGLTTDEPEVVELVVPRRRSPAVPEGVRLTRSDLPMVRANLWLPRTSIESTVIMLAAREDTDSTLALVGRALQDRKTTMTRLAGELSRWTRHPAGCWLPEVLTSDNDGAEGTLELRWARDVEQAHGIPPASRQARQLIGGVGCRHDLTYDEARLRIELDGFLFHDRARARTDRKKANATVVSGRSQLRYGWSEVVDEPCVTAAEVITFASSRGARWTTHPCRRPHCAVVR